MAKGKQPQWGWVRSPRSAKSQQVPEDLKAETTKRAEVLVAEWKPQVIKQILGRRVGVS
jgi:hypothetical protein